MILLIAYWFLLLPLFLGWGVLGHRSVVKYFNQHESSESLFVFILIGVVIVGFIANVCSLFFSLGNSPYLLLVLYALALGAIIKEREIVVAAIKQVRLFTVTGGVFFAILIIVVCKSAAPSEILDEKGYYLPFIKWVETYGITPGLANLQGRFGFNSSWHILSALLSLRWSGTLFYDLNGFITLVILGYYLLGVSKTVSPIRYICGLFVASFVFRNFLTSSAADLPNIYLGSLVILWMVGKYENKTLGEIDYTFIVSFFISFYLVTIKPSSIYLLLIYLPTISIVLLNKQFDRMVWLVCIGAMFIIPWCVRFYITTGYLVFPIAGIDIFNPDWKVPLESVIYERNAVKCFPIFDSLSIEEVLKMSFSEWFPQWFKKSPIEQKAFLITALVISLYHIVTLKKHLRTLNDRLFIAIQGMLLLNIVIWITQYPDFRFAWGYILVYVGIGIYFLLQEIVVLRKYTQQLILFFVVIMTSMNLVRTCKDVSGNYKNIVFQQAAFPEGEIQIQNINHVSYYKSEVVWDLPLPSILSWQNPAIELRTKSTLKNGFRPVNANKIDE
ncbi:hypothetical protein [Flavobacterium sp.]|uniref:LIC_10190 family membrane protein n=1 Tax=Flavobacterium sp. TaxID=239 RepID=UPI0025BF4260|nr:hypothetical protein [Flavobacterium sp.]